MTKPALFIIIILSLLLSAWLADESQAAPAFISPVVPTATPVPVSTWHIYMPIVVMED